MPTFLSTVLLWFYNGYLGRCLETSSTYSSFSAEMLPLPAFGSLFYPALKRHQKKRDPVGLKIKGCKKGIDKHPKVLKEIPEGGTNQIGWVENLHDASRSSSSNRQREETHPALSPFLGLRLVSNRIGLVSIDGFARSSCALVQSASG